MTALLASLTAILSLLPLVLNAINALEAAFPQKGVGLQKLDVLKTMVQGAYDVATPFQGAVTNAVPAFEALWPALNKVVTSVVAVKKVISGETPPTP